MEPTKTKVEQIIELEEIIRQKESEINRLKTEINKKKSAMIRKHLERLNMY
jgi:hypothetical protein